MLNESKHTNLLSDSHLRVFDYSADYAAVHVIVPKTYSFGTVDLAAICPPTRSVYAVSSMLQRPDNCLGTWQA